MKVLEQFLISLGIKVDDKSFQKADAAFDGLTKSALQLGSVLAGKLAIDKVVGDFKQAGTEINNFNRLTGISTKTLQTLGQAITAQGGSAADAFDDLKKMQDLMVSPITGNVGWMAEAARFGLDPNVIIGAKSTAEAFTNIGKAFESMTPLNQRLAGNALGFTEYSVRLMQKGGEEVERQLDARGKLAVMTKQQIEDAARLTKASSDLDSVFSDIGNTIGGELTPAFAEMAEEFVEFYRANKDLVDSGLKEFFGGVAENIELVAIAMTLLGGGAALKGLAALRALVGLSATGAGAGAATAAGTAGVSMLGVAGAGAAALLYSTSLNSGEDDELLNNRLKKGGAEAFNAVVGYLTKNGIPQEAAVGLAAGIEKESQFNAGAIGDNGKAYGLAQWHKPRQLDFYGANGKSIVGSSGKEQLDFVIHELTKGNERDKLAKLAAAKSNYEGGYVASQAYFRPAKKEAEAVSRGNRAAAYDASSIVAPAYGGSEGGVSGMNGNGGKSSPTYLDQRQYHINGADNEKVRQVLNEQMSKLTEQTMQDFKSPER